MSVAAANQNSEDKMEPYAAPAPSAVGSAERDPVNGPPREVVWAVRLLWLDLAIVVLRFLLPLSGTIKGKPVTVHFPRHLAVLIVAFQAYLIRKISRGENWARLLFLFLTASDLIWFFWASGRSSFEASVLQSRLDIVSRAMHVMAVYLLFTRSGSTWFKRPALAQDPPSAPAD